jgi:cytochrome c-type biogenesis protein CcsB
MGAASDDLFVATVMLYAIAMVAFAADLAFRRRRAPLTRMIPSQIAREEHRRVLVGAGGLLPSVRPSTGDQPPTSAVVQLVGDEPLRRSLPYLMAVGVTAVGWLSHLATIVTRGFAADRVPWGNMYEFSTVAAFIAVTALLVLLLRSRARWLGTFVMVPVVLYLGLTGTVLYAKAGPLVPALNSYWLKIHVVAAMSATGLFLVSGVTAVLHLAKHRRPTNTLMTRLPNAEILEQTTYRIIAFAFPVWTFAIMAGAIWAEAAWGRYWGWDPKETWSFITWVIYAAYLHSRATAGWKGVRSSWFAVAACAALFIDYYVVNMYIVGLHSYAGM